MEPLGLRPDGAITRSLAEPECADVSASFFRIWQKWNGLTFTYPVYESFQRQVCHSQRNIMTHCEEYLVDVRPEKSHDHNPKIRDGVFFSWAEHACRPMQCTRLSTCMHEKTLFTPHTSWDKGEWVLQGWPKVKKPGPSWVAIWTCYQSAFADYIWSSTSLVLH